MVQKFNNSVSHTFFLKRFCSTSSLISGAFPYYIWKSCSQTNRHLAVVKSNQLPYVKSTPIKQTIMEKLINKLTDLFMGK